jgi:hypothetical protein
VCQYAIQKLHSFFLSDPHGLVPWVKKFKESSQLSLNFAFLPHKAAGGLAACTVIMNILDIISVVMDIVFGRYKK